MGKRFDSRHSFGYLSGVPPSAPMVNTSLLPSSTARFWYPRPQSTFSMPSPTPPTSLIWTVAHPPTVVPQASVRLYPKRDTASLMSSASLPRNHRNQSALHPECFFYFTPCHCASRLPAGRPDRESICIPINCI